MRAARDACQLEMLGERSAIFLAMVRPAWGVAEQIMNIIRSELRPASGASAQNAQKSTAPITAAGKMRSAQSALQDRG
jgi:hypothetical protein